MRGNLTLYLLAVASMVLIATFYWLQPKRREHAKEQRIALCGLFVLVAIGTGFCLWSAFVERTPYTFERQDSPLAIAIAFDLSPSMLAEPHPTFGEQLPPRFERGKRVLLDVLRALEERNEPVIVSIAGFTQHGEILMGWDRNISQARDVLDFAVTPYLFGSSGTSIEAAAKAVARIFDMLPAELRRTSDKLVIVVSDGEDTMRASSFEYAHAQFAAAAFDTIALQTGLLDRDEGIPSYDADGEFVEFRAMRGRTITRPDPLAMNRIATASTGRGLHVRAESPAASQQILEFAVQTQSRAGKFDAAAVSTFGMFAVVSVLCFVIIR